MILTTLTFYVRSRIGYRTFHFIHYLTYAVFVMSLLHSWFSGTDTPALEIIYLASGLLVIFLTLFRILIALGDRLVSSTEPT
jgi:DMSO/TMAO reductase YedYZ heme-binding membrane subunit